MNLATLVIYGVINGAMVLSCLFGKKGRIYEFPFWIGALGIGYFFPMAIAQISNEAYPEHAYADGLLFATLCTLAAWSGFYYSSRKVSLRASWLNSSFDAENLVNAGIVLSVVGFYFHLKLSSLPEEMLAQTQWSGATVKYHFLASIFKIGFLTLWFIYLRQTKLIVPKIFIFLIPGLLILLESAVVGGRRAGMMDLTAYFLIGLWFTRRMALPRGLLIASLCGGLVLVSAIGTYRTVMKNEDLPLAERVKNLFKADLVGDSKQNVKESAFDFSNYIYYRKVIADEGNFDCGVSHWNRAVFQFVPAQIVGKEVKKSLIFKIGTRKEASIAEQRYGYKFRTGTVSTGYKDAFSSFGWLGVIKFWLIGWMMGVLYRHAMGGHFLAQLLYVYLLTTSMQSISHGTQQILVDKWIYFFVLGYPILHLAKRKDRTDNVYE